VISIDLRSFLHKRAWTWSIVLVVASATAFAQTDSTSEATRQPAWGTSDSPTAGTTLFETDIAAAVTAHQTFTGAAYGSGGVGLRNKGMGGIGISGVVTPVKAAYLYWAVITEGAAKTPDTQMKIQRLFPTPASAVTTVTGTLLGTGSSPCWGGTVISVYRASVPTTVSSGNGSYEVTLMPGAGGTTAGADPWLSETLPLFEGASLVVVGTGPATSRVVIYDTGLAGKTFGGNPGLTYSLTLPVATTGTLTLFDSIGADGQEGSSREAESGYGDEVTTINGTHFAGPGSLAINGDWNGSAGSPLPQLWDDTGHEITSATPKGTKTLNIKIANQGESSWDCLTPVANIVQEE
jgi:hypothetical protein